MREVHFAGIMRLACHLVDLTGETGNTVLALDLGRKAGIILAAGDDIPVINLDELREWRGEVSFAGFDTSILDFTVNGEEYTYSLTRREVAGLLLQLYTVLLRTADESIDTHDLSAFFRKG